MEFSVSSALRWGPWLGGALLGLLLLHGIWLRFGARIHSRERSYWIDQPFALTGRLDLVMQEWGGRLVVHDLKTRRSPRVFESDKLQLALYAFLLARATGRTVASHAVLRVQTPDGGVKLRCVLLDISPAQLHELASAFVDVSARPLSARLSANPSLCRRCGFNGRGCSGKLPAQR